VEELAEVYARSLFEVARETNKLDVVREQLGLIADAVSGDRDLQTFFFSPYFSAPEKEQGLARAFSGIDETVRNFLGLLIEKHRMPVLFRIRQRYEAMWLEENKVLPVQITSAIALDEATIGSIGERIGQRTGRRIALTSAVDPDILGGLVLRVGNSVADASIRNRLDILRRQVARG
jgi:ATP synthase F1 delta subunit